ncbi:MULTISPECIES: replication protein RepO [Klebsiella/Raoultella group]|uniref:replication protein RepO n=1 Tax=Klebsiella/Raoultella group TaxID=2890311 RepID=UPI000B95C42B|nr:MULTISPECIES: replication protein RepO [Klebsiella/Raoultella group]EKT9722336.1 replication protein RepO [Klebsiella pneumoniae]EKW6092671.1 replication protein RepO [Klebsiella pneumoniae]MCF7065415.1 replication protein RepO [Klebsiella variicola]MCF7098283.1 replication protein RepO [Klebsiella variicola]MEB6137216.1 replication protein RepO [Klebsiella pneumoniae]
MNILPLLDRPIAFQRSFIRLDIGVTAALFLSQMTYWTNRSDDDGWVYKTQEEWEEETGLSRYEQEGARKKLRSIGVLLEKRKGVPARLFYKVDNNVLYQVLVAANKNAEKPHTGMRKTNKQVRGKPANFLTENTTENIYTPNPLEGEGVELILSDAQKALEFYNEQTGTRCRDLKPFVMMLTPTTTREGYTLDELQLVIRWVLATWRRRGDSLPKPANICRVNRFDGYLADAEAWAVTETDIDPEAVMNGYNEIFADVLPAAELDTDRRRMITRLAAHMKNKTTGAFLGYFEKFRADASDFYFGENGGWRASFDYLMKPETLRKTREGSL